MAAAAARESCRAVAALASATKAAKAAPRGAGTMHGGSDARRHDLDLCLIVMPLSLLPASLVY